MQSFGRYPSLEEAARAYDIGYILFRGIRGKLNFGVSSYIDIASGTFHDYVELPLAIAHAISLYFKRGCTGPKGTLEEREAVRERMRSLFRPTICPPNHEKFLEQSGIFGAARHEPPPLPRALPLAHQVDVEFGSEPFPSAALSRLLTGSKRRACLEQQEAPSPESLPTKRRVCGGEH